MNLLDWDDLRVFLAVARTGGLAPASRRLKMDHSTVSRRIAHLESALGVSAFERTKAGFKLTDVGQRILRHAETVDSAIMGICAETGSETPTGGVVRLATMEGIASLYLAPRMVTLRQVAPDLRVELVTSPQVIHVSRREADLFLSFFRPPGQGLISEKIGSFDIHLYAAPAYLEERGTPSCRQDLELHDFITYIDDLIQVDAVRWQQDLIDLPVNTIFNSSSMIAQMSAAVAGLGMVVLPKFALQGAPSLVPVLPHELKATREIWVNAHQDLQFFPRIKTIIRFLKYQIKSDIINNKL